MLRVLDRRRCCCCGDCCGSACACCCCGGVEAGSATDPPPLVAEEEAAGAIPVFPAIIAAPALPAGRRCCVGGAEAGGGCPLDPLEPVPWFWRDGAAKGSTNGASTVRGARNTPTLEPDAEEEDKDEDDKDVPETDADADDPHAATARGEHGEPANTMSPSAAAAATAAATTGAAVGARRGNAGAAHEDAAAATWNAAAAASPPLAGILTVPSAPAPPALERRRDETLRVTAAAAAAAGSGNGASEAAVVMVAVCAEAGAATEDASGVLLATAAIPRRVPNLSAPWMAGGEKGANNTDTARATERHSGPRRRIPRFCLSPVCVLLCPASLRLRPRRARSQPALALALARSLCFALPLRRSFRQGPPSEPGRTVPATTARVTHTQTRCSCTHTHCPCCVCVELCAPPPCCSACVAWGVAHGTTHAPLRGTAALHAAPYCTTVTARQHHQGGERGWRGHRPSLSLFLSPLSVGWQLAACARARGPNARHPTPRRATDLHTSTRRRNTQASKRTGGGWGGSTIAALCVSLCRRSHLPLSRRNQKQNSGTDARTVCASAAAAPGPSDAPAQL
jgi:hypothetical protein